MVCKRASALVLLLLAACSARASVAEDELTITIEHSRFAPAEIAVEAGSTVTFVIRNEDPIDHEFIIGNEHLQLRHENGTKRHHGARPGEISVPAGAVRKTTYTFIEPGTLLIGCHLPGHYDYGMRGEITIIG